MDNLHTYIGTKVVMAEEMNECTAIGKGYARENTDGHELREGYHVKYQNPDGSTYDSWSPKGVFEAAYRKFGTFLDRMYIERDDLNDKLRKLHDFINSDRFDELDKENQKLLIEQETAMDVYLHILEQRIKLAEKS